MTEQIQTRKQKRRPPTTSELVEANEQRKVDEAAERFRRQLGLGSHAAQDVIEKIDEVLEEDCE